MKSIAESATKNYTKWNELLKIVILWWTDLYNKTKEFGEG